MADNFTQFSFTIDNITMAEAAWLLDFLSNEPPDNILIDFQDDDETLWIRDDCGCGNVNNAANITHKFLEKWRPQEVVTFQWADTCSKARVDEFGGGACAISATTILFKSSCEIADQLAKELQSSTTRESRVTMRQSNLEEYLVPYEVAQGSQEDIVTWLQDNEPEPVQEFADVWEFVSIQEEK